MRIVLSLAVAVPAIVVAPAGRDRPPPTSAPALSPAVRPTCPIPAHFELNRGQIPDGWDLFGRCRGYTAFVRAGEIVFSFGGRRVDLRVDGVAAGETPDLRGFETTSRANRFVGNDPRKWRRDIPVVTGAAYRGAVAGTAWTVRAAGRSLEFAWTVVGTDEPAFRIVGADAPRVERDGRLRVATPEGVATLTAPVAWQDVGGVRRTVDAAYRVADDGRVVVALGARDAARPVVVDPTVDFETYLGGTRADDAQFSSFNNAATNAAGDAFFCGDTQSSDFPVTAGSYRTTKAPTTLQFDMWVACVRAGATGFSWCTYLGGTGSESGGAARVDGAGNVVVSGTSPASDYPTTPGVIGATSPGGVAAVRTKLTGDGGSLVWSTYLAGVSSVQFALGPGGDMYVPTATGVRKYSADATSIAWSNTLTPSTTIGTQTTTFSAVAVDAADQAYVVGSTNQTNFALTPGTYQTSLAGGIDGLVVKCDSAGGVVWATLVGGTGDDAFGRVGVDGSGRVVAGGATTSGTFPLTAGAFQSTFGGGVRDGMVARLSSDGASLQWSTLLGGADNDLLYSLAVHPCGAVVVAGTTYSTGMPTKNAFQSLPSGGVNHGWITVFDSTGAAALSSFVGGSNSDYGTGAAWTPEGGVVATGFTSSTDFPTANAPQTSLAGNTDAWCLRVADALAGTPDVPVITTSSLADATSSTDCSRGLAATGGNGVYSWSVVAGQLPPELSLSGTGVIAGTPSGAGTASFTVRAADGYGVASTKPFTMHVNAFPIVTSAPPPWTRGMPYDVQLTTAQGTPPFTWTVSNGTAPPGLSLSSAGALTGAPTSTGSHPFTVRAQDAVGAAATKAVTLVVHDPPTVAGRTLPPAAVGRQYNADAAAAAGTSPGTWSKSSGDLPPGLALDAATGRIGGRPTAAASSHVVLAYRDAAQAAASGEFALDCAEQAVLTKKRATGVLSVVADGPTTVRRFLELTAGCLLDVTVSGGGTAGAGPAVRLRSADGGDVALGAALTTTAKGARLKRFAVPATGRWFLEVEAAAGFVGKMKFSVAITPPRKWTSQTNVDAAAAPVDVPFSSPPGALVTVSVKPAKKSAGRPKLVSLKPVVGGDLLTGGTTKTTKAGALTFTSKATLAGGDYVLRFTSEPGAAGPVVWTVTLKPPGTYGFDMSGVAAGE